MARRSVKVAEEKPKPEHISMAGLMLGRGWTKAGVARFLDPPDREAPNPNYRNAAPMKLYKLERVAAAEASSAYQAWAEASAVRKRRAQGAVQTRRAATLASVDGWRPSVDAGSLDDVRAQAIVHYNARRWIRDLDVEPEPARLTSDPQFLERITVNYLRHAVSDYDDVLADLTRRVGKDEAYICVRTKVLEEIARVYPKLAAEAERQRLRER